MVSQNIMHMDGMHAKDVEPPPFLDGCRGSRVEGFHMLLRDSRVTAETLADDLADIQRGSGPGQERWARGSKQCISFKFLWDLVHAKNSS